MMNTTSYNRGALHAAAADVLSPSLLVAWEPNHQQRTVDLVRQFMAGSVWPAQLRAALGRSDRPAPVNAPKSTAVLSLTGVLTPDVSLFTLLGCGTALQTFQQQLRAAGADASVTQILVVTDSPGGYVGLVPETAALMRAVRATKPLMAITTGLNASAAYWITANASTNEATPSALVGAIGVRGATRLSFARQLERDGVDVFVPAAGKFKAEGDPALPITAEEMAAATARVEEAYTGFVNDVAAGRQVAAQAVRTGFGEGRILSAARALQAGLIDRVSLLEESVGRVIQGVGMARALAEDDHDVQRLERLLGRRIRSTSDESDDEERRRRRFLY